MVKLIVPVPSALSIRLPKDGKLRVVRVIAFPSGSVADIFTSSVSSSFMPCAAIIVKTGERLTSFTVNVNVTVSANDGLPLSTAII